MTPAWKKKRTFVPPLQMPGQLIRGMGALFAAFTFFALPVRAAVTETDAVFDGPNAAYAEPIAASAPAATETLRTIYVEDRVGMPRRGELVRVPLFFSKGECRSLEDLALVEIGNAEKSGEIAWQADDIRHGPDGGISRFHLWFEIDLQPGEQRRFELMRRTRDATRRETSSPVSVQRAVHELRFTTDTGAVVFTAEGTLRRVTGAGAGWDFGDAGVFPRIAVAFPANVGRPAAEVRLDRGSPTRDVEWASGLLFAKVRTRVTGPDGLTLEQEFRIPRHGREIVVSTALFVGERAGGVVKVNELLEGRLRSTDGKSATVLRVPAGIRFALRAEHAYAVTALARGSTHDALLAIPLVIGGSNGLWKVESNGALSLSGQNGLRQGKEGEKESLHAYWSEVRLVPAAAESPDELWRIYREHVQPLVAIVEEPGANIDALHAALRDVVREMKPVGWRQNAGRAFVLGDVARAEKILKQSSTAKQADPESLERSADNARARQTKNGTRKLRDDEKSRAYGPLDPYDITYTQSAAAALATLTDAPPGVTAVNRAMAAALRRVGGRVDAAGNPYIDCFGRALNMQMGPVLFGLTAGASLHDSGTVRFYRDLATSPPVLGIFGRGQRPYTAAPAKTPDQTDYLYQSVCDFWLRATELLANENLQLHPLAYGRYTDCIDVMADRYHDASAHNKAHLRGFARANFFRGQAHTHRWLGWSCAPFIRLLADPAEHSAIGLTEAIHYARLQKGRWKNWPDLTFYVLADLLVGAAPQHSVTPALPPAPGNLQVARTSHGTTLTWSAVSGASGYRIHRAPHAGGPWTLLNSPHTETAAPNLAMAPFHDPEGDSASSYIVTAIDADGRESVWPAE